MSITSILGTVGTILGTVRAMPQLVRLLYAQEAFGVSVDTAATGAICSFGWLAYGILTGQFYFSLSSGLTGLILAMIALFALHFGRRIKEFKIAPIWCSLFFSYLGLSAVKMDLAWFCRSAF